MTLQLQRRSGLWLWIFWHAGTAAAIFLLGNVWIQRHSGLPRQFLPFVTSLIFAHALLAAAVGIQTSGGRRLPASEFAVQLAGIFGLVCAMTLLTGGHYSKGLLLLVPPASGISIVSSSLLTSRQLRLTCVAACTALVALYARIYRNTHQPDSGQSPLVVSSDYSFQVAEVPVGGAPIDVSGGGLAALGTDYLVVTGDGRLVRFRWNHDGALTPTEIDLRVPSNREQFIQDLPRHGEGLEDGRLFRVGDVAIAREDNSYRIYVSHLYWHTDTKCASLRIDFLQTDPTTLFEHARNLQWHTLYDSTPCVALKTVGHAVAGHQVGGRLAFLGADTLLMTTGDLEFDGVNGNPQLPQDPASPYGKTLLIDLHSGAASVYSTGHRNPEGLFIDTDGTVWETEHGPLGGDELNRITRGANYGWPLTTLGRNYDGLPWPSSPPEPRAFTTASFAWMPSIGISEVAVSHSAALSRWRDNLLVASLGNHALFRLQLDSGHVLYQERIQVGRRIRDFLEDPSGRLILWTEGAFLGPTDGEVMVLSPIDDSGEAADSEVLHPELIARRRCSGCHRLDERSDDATIGPSLQGVWNRPVASSSGFSYSAAIGRLGGRWTEQRLNEFLANPEAYAPGTLMKGVQVTNAAERAAVLQYLKTTK